MALLSKSPSAFVALGYVTAGALIGAWSLIWFWWLHGHPPATESVYYLCYGSIATGAILFVVGLSLGAIGRAARRAELPPPEATPAAAQVDQNLASRTPVVPVVTTGMAPPAMPAGTVPTAQPVAATANTSRVG